MKPVDGALKGLPVSAYFFDYQSNDSSWASRPPIASCLATYIGAVSAAYRRAGGDGKVIVVAHSMGGLATRFASNARYAAVPTASDLGGVVTIDTPHLGSPFGDQAVARAMEATLGRHPTSVRHQPTPGTDASICLAAHHPPANKLPHGCALAPYLPANVPITQLAGDISVQRTLFGIPLYTVDLYTDGVVPVDSSHGYINSGPGGRAPRGTATDQPTVSCKVNFDQVNAIAFAQGYLANGAEGSLSGIADLLSPTIFSDSHALDQLETGQIGPQLFAFLAAAYVTAPCSHTGMLTDPASLADVRRAVSDDIQHLAAPPPAAPATAGPASSLTLLHWHSAEAVDTQGDCAGTAACVIHSVACASEALCVAVGEPNLVFVSTNPTAPTPQWTSYARPVAESFGSIACLPKLCVAGTSVDGELDVSSDPTLGPSSWSRFPQTSDPIAGVSCISASLCAAISGSGVLTSTDGGQSWPTAATFSDPATLNAISCAEPDFCAAVGGTTAASSLAPTSSRWTEATIPLPGAGALESISCPQPSFCGAAGQTAVVISSDPGNARPQWTMVQLPGYSLGGAIACPSAGLCVVGDSGGDIFTSDNASGGAGAWHEQHVPVNGGFTGISCPTTQLCVAATTDGELVNATP